MKNVIFSFFSGAGFLDLGFEQEGFEVVFANEIEQEFINAYTHSRKQMGIHLPKYGIHKDSIDTFLVDEKKDYLQNLIAQEKSSHSTIGFIGGPPCPDFSVGGKNAGKEGERGKLSQSYIDCIKVFQPDWFVFENVKGLWRTKKHREFYEHLKTELFRAGYKLQDRLINSMEFGVPQDRDRIILFGVKRSILNTEDQDLSWTKYMAYPDWSPNDHQWPTTNAFQQNIEKPSDVPYELTIDYWFKKNNVDTHPNGKCHFTPRAGLSRFLVIEEGDTSKKSYKRLHRYRYSPTAAYGNNEVHLHPTLARRLSAAEALAIQSLPENYILPKEMTLTAKFKTIGNGVPYLLSNGLAKSVKTFLEQI